MREHILITIQKGNGLYDSALKANFGEDRIAHFGEALSRASTLTIDAFLEHRADLLDIVAGNGVAIISPAVKAFS